MTALRSALAPSPPRGYREGRIFRYPRLGLQLAAVATAATALPALVVATWLLQGKPPWREVPIAFADAWPLVAALATILAHELVHGLAMRLLGYQVTYGFYWRMFSAYATALGQFQRRRHALLIILAPLVVIDCSLLPALALPDARLVTLAFAAIFVNTVGAVGDVYLALQLLRLPRRTLVCDVSPAEMLIFEPGKPR